MHPELIGVDIPLEIDTGDPDARAVKPSTVPAEHLVDLFRSRILLFEHLEIEVGSITVVVDGQDLDINPSLVEVLCPSKKGVDRFPGLFGGEIDHPIPSPRGDEMVKTGPADPLFFDEVEDSVDVVYVLPCERHPKTDLLTPLGQALHPLHRTIEGPWDPSKEVVGLLEAVETDPDVRESGRQDPVGHPFIDQGPVGRDHRADPERAGLLRQFEEVFPCERLPSGEEEGGDLVSSEVFDQALSLFGGQLVGVLFRLGIGVAMDAAEVAGLRAVPDHHGAAFLCRFRELVDLSLRRRSPL